MINIGWGNGMVPNRHHAITSTNVDQVITVPTGTQISEIWIKLQIFSLKKVSLRYHLQKSYHFAQLSICVNLRAPTEAIWQHRSRSTMAQVMDCCQAAPSHYLNQFWLLIINFLWHPHESNFMASTQATILYNDFENCIFRISATSPRGKWVNSLRPRQNRRHFADDVFKCNFLNENVWIQIKISLKFVPKGPINNIPALVQIMAWCRIGDKPLSEPMMAQFNDAYMRHSASMS